MEFRVWCMWRTGFVVEGLGLVVPGIERREASGRFGVSSAHSGSFLSPCLSQDRGN